MAVTDTQLVAWLKSDTAKRRILMEVGVMVDGTTETTRYISDKGYTTLGGETPSNTTYLPLISSGVSFTEEISLSGEVSLSVGEVEFDNNDGSLDGWQDDIWQGRNCKIYIGDYSWPRNDFYKIFDGVVAQADCTSRDRFTLVLSDKLQKLNTTVSEVKLGGTGPNKDKLIPLLFGECHNISPLLVDVANHEYQIHNGPIEDIIEVRDNGVPVSITKYLSTGKFRLNQAPVGTITCDAQGDKPSTYANDAVALIKRLVKDYGLVGNRFTDSDLDLTSLSTFAAANTQPLGLYLTEKTGVFEACNRLAASIGSRVAMTVAGLMKIIKLDLPQATAGTTATADDMMLQNIAVTQLTTVQAAIKINYDKCWTIQEALQTGIPANHIELFGQEYLSSTATNSLVATKYKLFTDPTAIDTLLITAGSADAEAARLLALWSAQRRVLTYTALPHLILEPLGNPQTIQHNRFGLSAGVRGQIVRKTTNWLTATTEFGVLI